MEILTTLSPAETYLLAEGSSAKLSEILKLTFADLVRKRVLQITEEEHQSHPNNPPRLISYVGVGDQYSEYRFLLHEFPFIQAFESVRDIQFLFSNYVKVCFQNAGRRKSYIYGAFIENGRLGNNFKQDWLSKFFGGPYFSDDGMEANRKVVLAIHQLEADLPQLIDQDRERAIRLLKQIGGNIYLLRNLDLKALPQLAEEFESFRKGNTSGYDNGCSGYVFFDDFSTSFDNSCSSDSGWGGDSGCGSGCSGCGGCGGCS